MRGLAHGPTVDEDHWVPWETNPDLSQASPTRSQLSHPATSFDEIHEEIIL